MKLSRRETQDPTLKNIDLTIYQLVESFAIAVI